MTILINFHFEFFEKNFKPTADEEYENFAKTISALIFSFLFYRNLKLHIFISTFLSYILWLFLITL